MIENPLVTERWRVWDGWRWWRRNAPIITQLRFLKTFYSLIFFCFTEQKRTRQNIVNDKERRRNKCKEKTDSSEVENIYSKLKVGHQSPIIASRPIKKRNLYLAVCIITIDPFKPLLKISFISQQLESSLLTPLSIQTLLYIRLIAGSTLFHSN